MQPLHLWFRDLRAISLGQSPSRWQTHSMRRASKWETASPLPNPLRPTCAVGWRPAAQHPDGIPCPVAGAGSPWVPRVRAARKDSRGPVLPCRVRRWQTAREPVPDPARQEAGDRGTAHGQARASEVRCTPSAGLSFPLRPQRCGARAFGEKMADLTAKAGVNGGTRWRRSHCEAG